MCLPTAMYCFWLYCCQLTVTVPNMTLQQCASRAHHGCSSHCVSLQSSAQQIITKRKQGPLIGPANCASDLLPFPTHSADGDRSCWCSRSQKLYFKPTSRFLNVDVRRRSWSAGHMGVQLAIRGLIRVIKRDGVRMRTEHLISDTVAAIAAQAASASACHCSVRPCSYCYSSSKQYLLLPLATALTLVPSPFYAYYHELTRIYCCVQSSWPVQLPEAALPSDMPPNRETQGWHATQRPGRHRQPVYW
jgi:hypothetical protein